MDALGWPLKLCDRVRPMAARLRVGEEPIRCSPLKRRCRPLSFVGRSIGIASTAGVPGVGVAMSSGCSKTTESIDVGSMLLYSCAVDDRGDGGRLRAGEKRPSQVLLKYTTTSSHNSKVPAPRTAFLSLLSCTPKRKQKSTANPVVGCAVFDGSSPSSRKRGAEARVRDDVSARS